MKHKYIENVATLSYEMEKCVGCGRCGEVCPHHVFEIQAGKAELVGKDRCMECGACVKNCPANAIAVDSGVGCAAAVIKGWLTNSEPSCDCSSDSECC